MMENKQAPYHWIEKIDEATFREDESPLIAGYYPIDLKSIEEQLASFFSIDDLKITIGEKKWREDIQEGLSKDISITSVTLSPLSSHLSLLIDEIDKKKLTSFSLGDLKSEIQSNKALENSYFLFSLLETISFMEKQGFFPGLSPKITGEKASLEKAYCIDLNIQKNSTSILIRLALLEPFRRSWNQHFIQSYPLEITKELAENLEVPLSIQVGKVHFNSQDLEQLASGDFILLDKCTYNPDTHRGSAVIVLHNIPLFRARLKQAKIKLLDYSLYNEATTMTEDTPENNNYEEEFSEEDEVIEPLAEAKEEKAISLQDLPLEVIIEVARCNISLSKLKNLQPGNFLELPVVPDQGINLTVNGKKIGDGELVYLGEKLGVRIIKMAK